MASHSRSASRPFSVIEYTVRDLPVLGPQEPLHRRGIVESEPGLYFIGLKFLYSVSSEQIQGVGRDADYIAGKIAGRRGVRRADQSTSDSPEESKAQQI